MNEKIIKKILLDNLNEINDKDFNTTIIEQLNFSKKAKVVLFTERSILKTFLIIALLVLIVNTELIKILTLPHLLIGISICLIPLYLLLFNKIYQASTQQFSTTTKQL